MRRYVRFYPGEYTPEEQKVVDEADRYYKENLQPGSLDYEIDVTEEQISEYARLYDPYNPLYSDPEYGKKTRWGRRMALPTAPYRMFDTYFSDIDDILCKLGDVFYFANDGGDLYFYRPVFAGDHLKVYRDFRSFEDDTDPKGSIYRRFTLRGASNMYNQYGEQVARGEGSGRNAVVKFSDGGPVPSDFDQCFEWVKYAPKTHVTTDEEWVQIRQMWKDEKIRGADTLYWDDVRIGDMPTPVCSGPISGMDLVRLHGEAFIKLPSTREILESGGELMKDPLGMYQQFTARHYCGCNIPGNHAVFYNFTVRDFITRMVTNWMGDDGFITHIGWRFQNLYECMSHNEPGKEILDKVPSMQGRYVNRHGVEGDTAICRGYVTDKYVDEKGRACVDLSCWAETFDDDIIQIVQITVALPRR